MSEYARITNSNLPDKGADTKSLPAKLRDQVTITITNNTEHKKINTLAMILRETEVGREILKYIDKTTVYIAKIPANLKDGWEKGDLTFMKKSDTGESLGVIVSTNKSEFGNKGFVRIEEVQFSNADIPRSLADLATQQQLAHIAEVVDEIRTRVIQLQETYDHELLGDLRGMHKQLQQIINTTDPETQKQLTTNAITVLNTTRGRIAQRLLDEIKRMPEAPRNRLIAVIKTFFSKDFYSKLEYGYDKTQELFEYYLASTQMLAYAYAFLNEKKALDIVFMPEQELMAEAFMEKLAKAERLCGITTNSSWYHHPDEFLGMLSTACIDTFDKELDVIEVEVTGQQLLEAGDNEQSV